MASKSKPAKTGRPVGTTAPSSDAVARIRKALGITQLQMAAKIGVGYSTLQRCESLGKLPTNAASMLLLSQLAEQAGETI